jgi:SAM-dependent methyltransferase
MTAMACQSVLDRVLNVRILRKSPINAYLRISRRMWERLPVGLVNLGPLRAYGRVLHSLVKLRATRHQHFGTYFFRNRPQLTLIRRLIDQRGPASTVNITFLACSNGAEAYSILWTIRSGRPARRVASHAVDISPRVLNVARSGTYSLIAPDFVEAPIFVRITDTEMDAMFDVSDDGTRATIKSWLREKIDWHLADAGSPELLDVLGPQDIVIANNFLCHMTPPNANRCLRNVARLVRPGGYLVVSGIDLDIRTRVAMDLGWKPVRDLIEAVHDGDPSVRNDWPWQYWSLEPLNKKRRDWEVRYASVFELPGHAEGGR